jgi:micrococcal nuclease
MNDARCRCLGGCLALALVGLMVCGSAWADFTGRVVAAPSGDVLDVRHGTTVTRVRLAGIDAPEARQRFGLEARRRLSERAVGRQVRVEALGLTLRGYTVGLVLSFGIDLGLGQVQDGMAWYAGRRAGTLSPRADRQYRAAQAAARKARRGLWRDLNPMSPWDWREMRRRAGRLP